MFDDSGAQLALDDRMWVELLANFVGHHRDPRPREPARGRTSLELALVLVLSDLYPVPAEAGDSGLLVHVRLKLGCCCTIVASTVASHSGQLQLPQVLVVTFQIQTLVQLQPAVYR